MTSRWSVRSSDARFSGATRELFQLAWPIAAAMLVRGVDRYNYFDHEPRLSRDFDPAVEPFRQDAIARYNQARDEQVALKAGLPA